MPFRVIVAECDRWQKLIATFLQEQLNRLDVDDPFIVKSSDQVIDFVKTCVDEHVYGFSVDMTDLYYSIPLNQLLPAVEECIDLFGSVRFQTECGIPVSRFLELLSFYLKSTYISWDDKPFIQKDGICIGSCIAPILSDIFLSRIDRSINLHLDILNIKKVFQYVDDYLVLLTNDTVADEAGLAKIISQFSECFKPLTLTHELPESNAIKFLDVLFTFHPNRICWAYQPRMNKPVLPYQSAHSKLVKRGIISHCFRHALSKSCEHEIANSFHNQSDRLLKAGYPLHVQTSVAEGLLRNRTLRNPGCTASHDAEKPKHLVVIPYYHKISHNLKKLAKRSEVRVVFSAPKKLVSLCGLHDHDGKPKGCNKKHRTVLVPCITCVVYRIPLSCGKEYTDGPLP
ncbi:uncharacterized protein LOC125758156 [Rhipicephalus sanguineus]|uniref:uncharacterized protein LOC125758156 n=1 Tax=Rhipicephalus sanguineus TaxID=34632 RepID=UPI0020C2DBE6|nr:uncharacterized protein LOC125758156 [Rhipicephalus sanguineus]